MNLCIVGGGTAGWMAAAGLSKKLKNAIKTITLVESEVIGTVGVGEATLPHIKLFNEALGIDESAFMKYTEATFKLGIQFCDWGKVGQHYIHPFGDFGQPVNNMDFYQYWIKLNQHGAFGTLDEYAYGIVAAKNNKFQFPSNGQTSIQKSFGYAYQFDASLYAKFLRQYSQSNGVRRIEGKVCNVQQDNHTGDIKSISLEDGQIIEADIFIDCSGFRGLLIEQSLESGYQDWSKWLPCNRAVAIPCETADPSNIPPYTRATARTAGWQWRIPLQHRTGNGYVYWSEFISDDEACNFLLKHLDGPALAEPNQLYFTTGRRNHFWKNNVIAIGLSAGFLEPLESTSIHLIQEGITNLIELFPQNSTQKNSHERAEYNTRMALQYERIRDFLLLHYVATARDDSGMWRYFRNMELPESLQQKIDSWLHRGYIHRYEHGAFLPPSWVAVMMGQNLIPRAYDRRVDNIPYNKLSHIANQLRNDISGSVDKAKTHTAFLKSIGAASNTPSLRVSR